MVPFQILDDILLAMKDGQRRIKVHHHPHLKVVLFVFSSAMTFFPRLAISQI